jgi:inosine/xanthosine triphosphatase
MKSNQVIIASHNPVKLQAAKNGFNQIFPESKFVWIQADAPSGVSKQPFSDTETLMGAINRVGYIQENFPEAAFWIGIEGGIQFDDNSQMSAFAWIVIKNSELMGKARSGTFFLPPRVARLVKSGLELGEADDLVFDQKNSKQNNGAIGLLTGDILTRTSLYEHAVLLALIPFLNPALYK